MQFRRRNRPAVVINIAPLVDVVFLLVIFFAVSTTFQDSAGLKLELPTSSSRADREIRDITIGLSAEGEILFEEQLVALDELRRRLPQALEQHERKVVVLKADTATRHGDVVRIMDLIREAGAVSLMVAARASGAD